MNQALKDVVVPVLREHGFKGSLPHFRRLLPERIDLFTFQFDLHGGGFVIEIGQCEPDGFMTHWGKQIEPSKVTAWDVSPKKRARIQPSDGSRTDSWFRFDGTATDIFTRIAEVVVPFVEQAETMFNNFEHVKKIGQGPNSP